MTGHERSRRQPAHCTCRRDVGLLLMRLGIGAVLMAHGGQKLFGLFGGGGIEGTAAAMESMGFEPGRESAIAAGVGETGGGALLALGLATPAAGAAAAGTMAAAASVNWQKGLFAMRGGYELPLLIGLGARHGGCGRRRDQPPQSGAGPPRGRRDRGVLRPGRMTAAAAVV